MQARVVRVIGPVQHRVQHGLLQRNNILQNVQRSALSTRLNRGSMITRRHFEFGFLRWSRDSKDESPVAPPAVGNSVEDLSTLPDLPEAPKYPCPHLLDEEVAQYLEPLYKRSWYIGVRVLKWNDQMRVPLVLAKKMDFLTFDDALKFTNELTEVVRSENHHPQISISPSGRLSLETDTHTATIPGVCPSDRKSPQHIYPGVTLRDVRFAILAERLWQKHRFELGTAKETQYEINSSRLLTSIRKNSGFRALGYFPPTSFADDLWKNVKMETMAFMISDEVGSR